MKNNIESTFRKLNESELDLLVFLLSQDFPGRDILKEQLKTCKVMTIDKEGGLKFDIKSDSTAPVIRRVPIEAEMLDADGIKVHILLHVINGKLSELEFYKDDGSEIINEVLISNLKLFKL